MSRITALLAIAAAGAAVAAGATYEIDPAHSSAQFSVRHMMVSNVRGEFSGVKGTIVYDPNDLAASKLEAIIDASTINTREPKRDAHLKSADFLDIEKFPALTFRSRRFERGPDGKLKVVGDLTIHGVTKEAALSIDGPSQEVKDQRGTAHVGASATTAVNRSDFGLTWNRALEAGGVLVGDEVKITLDVEMVKK